MELGWRHAWIGLRGVDDAQWWWWWYWGAERGKHFESSIITSEIEISPFLPLSLSSSSSTGQSVISVSRSLYDSPLLLVE